MGMIASGIWLGSGFSWEPITVLLFALGAFIESDFGVIHSIKKQENTPFRENHITNIKNKEAVDKNASIDMLGKKSKSISPPILDSITPETIYENLAKMKKKCTLLEYNHATFIHKYLHQKVKWNLEIFGITINKNFVSIDLMDREGNSHLGAYVTIKIPLKDMHLIKLLKKGDIVVVSGKITEIAETESQGIFLEDIDEIKKL